MKESKFTRRARETKLRYAKERNEDSKPNVQELTEEEMMQIAIDRSLKETEQKKQNATVVQIPSEFDNEGVVEKPQVVNQIYYGKKMGERAPGEKFKGTTEQISLQFLDEM